MGHLTSESAARTAMMVNINPSEEDFDETQHVLAYSRKAKLIEIDMKEYGMKRKEFFGEEYDVNGRKKPKLGENSHRTAGIVLKKSKNTFLSRMTKKLSPKRAEQKRFTSEEIAKENEEFATNDLDDEEIETLKKSMKVMKEKIGRLENKNMQLLDELDNKEDQIRIEVSMEMEERLRETRTKYNEKFEQLRSMMHRQASKADISVSMNRAENQLEELMDKIDECEKEMLRMSQQHKQIITALNSQIEELQRKDQLAMKEKAEDNLKISLLEKTLEKCNQKIGRLKDFEDDAQKIEGKNMTQKDDRNNNKASTFRRRLRPRKPLGNYTNQVMGSRVFSVDMT